MTNSFGLDVNIIDAECPLNIDGVPFSNVAMITLRIDGTQVLRAPDFSSALIHFPELMASCHSSGTYLIFTCACGIADDGGWEGVQVVHDEECIRWSFSVNATPYAYVFDARQYREAVEQVRIRLETLPAHVTLEPQHVVFPERWNQP